MDAQIQYEQTYAKAKQIIDFINELSVNDEYAYERIIYFLGAFGPMELIGGCLTEDMRLVRARVHKENVLFAKKYEVGPPPESVKLARCHPGHKSKFYGSNREEVSLLETLPDFIREEGLSEGEVVFTTLSEWKVVGEGIPVCRFASPMEEDWKTDLDRGAGNSYLKFIEEKYGENKDTLNALKALTHFFFSIFNINKKVDPTVYVKTSALLGYVFGFHTGFKGVFYNSTCGIEQGHNIALHSDIFTTNRVVLADVRRVAWTVGGVNEYGAIAMSEKVAKEVTEKGEIIW